MGDPSRQPLQCMCVLSGAVRPRLDLPPHHPSSGLRGIIERHSLRIIASFLKSRGPAND